MREKLSIKGFFSKQPDLCSSQRSLVLYEYRRDAKIYIHTCFLFRACHKRLESGPVEVNSSPTQPIKILGSDVDSPCS